MDAEKDGQAETVAIGTASRRVVVAGGIGALLSAVLAAPGIDAADKRRKRGKTGGSPRPVADDATAGGQPGPEVGKGAELLFSEDELKRAEDGAAVVAKAVTTVASARSGRRGTRAGRLVLDERKLSGLDQDLIDAVKKFVADTNANKVGFALTDKKGGAVTVFGNQKALQFGAVPQSAGGAGEDRANYTWRDSWGAHAYIDPWWTGLINTLALAALTAIAGIIAGALCATGILCAVVGVVVRMVAAAVSYVVRPYLPQDLFFHIQRYTRYVYVQPRRYGRWYHNRWFYVTRL